MLTALLVVGGCGDTRGPTAVGPPDVYEREIQAWVETPEVQALDPRSLRQVEGMSHAYQVSGSLLEATNRADVAVLGAVERTRFWRDVTITRIRVERVAKGAVPDVITVVQLASLRPGDAFHDPTLRTYGAMIVLDTTEPTLFAGDRAVLFLEEEERFRADIGPAYRIQPWTGMRTVDGRVQPLATCQFREDVEGDAADDVMDRIKAYV